MDDTNPETSHDPTATIEQPLKTMEHIASENILSMEPEQLTEYTNENKHSANIVEDQEEIDEAQQTPAGTDVSNISNSILCNPELSPSTEIEQLTDMNELRSVEPTGTLQDSPLDSGQSQTTMENIALENILSIEPEQLTEFAIESFEVNGHEVKVEHPNENIDAANVDETLDNQNELEQMQNIPEETKDNVTDGILRNPELSPKTEIEELTETYDNSITEIVNEPSEVTEYIPTDNESHIEIQHEETQPTSSDMSDKVLNVEPVHESIREVEDDSQIEQPEQTNSVQTPVENEEIISIRSSNLELAPSPVNDDVPREINDQIIYNATEDSTTVDQEQVIEVEDNKTENAVESMPVPSDQQPVDIEPKNQATTDVIFTDSELSPSTEYEQLTDTLPINANFVDDGHPKDTKPSEVPENSFESTNMIFSNQELTPTFEEEQLTNIPDESSKTTQETPTIQVFSATESVISLDPEQLTEFENNVMDANIESTPVPPAQQNEYDQLPVNVETVCAENKPLQESSLPISHITSNDFSAKENIKPTEKREGDYDVFKHVPRSPKRKPITDITNQRSRTLDPKQAVLWRDTYSDPRRKSATLGRDSSRRRRLQPKPSLDDDHLFPNAVTPSKVDPLIRTRSLSRGLPDGMYDVPYIDDDAFVARKLRSKHNDYDNVDGDENSSEDDDLYWQISNEIPDHLDISHLADMNECMLTPETVHKTKAEPKYKNGKRSKFKFCSCVGRQKAES